MDGAHYVYNPKTVEEVFRDFKGRRTAIIKALTSDVADFYLQCDPEKENLCLYGLPNERWEVTLPAEEVPPQLPEPALGINFARDGMQEKDWLSLVAVHSDAWLISIAFYYGARFGFDKADRKRLFGMINDMPTLFEVVNEENKSRITGTSSNNDRSNGRSKPHSEMQKASEDQAYKNTKLIQPKEEEDEEDEIIKGEEGDEAGEEGEDDEIIKGEEWDEAGEEGEDDEIIKDEEWDEAGEEGEDDEHGETFCGACGDIYASDEFWICCDLCEIWFHGKCVKITPARAEHINQYKCPSCSISNKRARLS